MTKNDNSATIGLIYHNYHLLVMTRCWLKFPSHNLQQFCDRIITFEKINIYLGSANNGTRLKIKKHLTVANKAFYGLSNLISSKRLSRNAKLRVYQTIIRPVMIHGGEARTLPTHKFELCSFERNSQQKIITIQKSDIATSN